MASLSVPGCAGRSTNRMRGRRMQSLRRNVLESKRGRNLQYHEEDRVINKSKPIVPLLQFNCGSTPGLLRSKCT